MNKYLLFLISFLYASHLVGEEVNVIEIRYQVFVENADSLSSYKYKLPYETFHIVSPDKVVTMSKYAADIDEVHMYDLEDVLDYRFYFRENGENLAVKSPLQQIPTLVTNTDDEQRYQIGGMLCKRYEVVHKNSTIEIYTTDSFGVDFTPFSQVRGYAMQYSFIDDVYGRVTYIAQSIFPTVADASIFGLSNYKVTEKAFPEDLRNPLEELLVAKESSSLFKLNKKKINYKFKLTDKTKVDEETNKDNLVVFAVGGLHKYNGLEKDLLAGLIESVEGKKVKFYFFGLKSSYSRKEIVELEKLGFEVGYLRDVIMSKFKIEYFPTYVLMDKDRKVIKYKVGTNSQMLSSFAEKIIELGN